MVCYLKETCQALAWKTLKFQKKNVDFQSVLLVKEETDWEVSASRTLN